MEDKKTKKFLSDEGIELTDQQYEVLALIDITSKCKCSVYEVLKILKILNLI